MQNIFNVTKDCPNCGANAEITVYGHVNEIENPGVGALIGSYRAHMHHCPKCGVPILYRYTTIYEDVENNVIFAFTREKEYAKKIREEFKALKAQDSMYANCKLRLFSNIENFIGAVSLHDDEYRFDEEGYQEFVKHMEEVEEMLGL